MDINIKDVREKNKSNKSSTGAVSPNGNANIDLLNEIMGNINSRIAYDSMILDKIKAIAQV